MLSAFALFAAGLLALLGVLHVYWAFGPGGQSPGVVPTRPDGTPLFQPGPVACIGVALLLLTGAYLILEKAGRGPDWIPNPWRSLGATAVAAALILRGIGDFRYVGLFKRYRESEFARNDTRFYTPLVLALGLIAAMVAASPP